jgi:hypothetical protein
MLAHGAKRECLRLDPIAGLENMALGRGEQHSIDERAQARVLRPAGGAFEQVRSYPRDRRVGGGAGDL